MGVYVEDQLGEVRHPVLVLARRYDRACAVGASQDMARRSAAPDLVVYENFAHMTFAEEQGSYLATVGWILDRTTN